MYRNLASTGLSIAICFIICFIIGTIEVLGLLLMDLHVQDSFWNFMENFNINTAGFVVVGMFVLTLVLASSSSGSSARSRRSGGRATR